MTTRKTALNRRQESPDFPSAVIKAKKDLGKRNDDYFRVMKKLTETKDLHLSTALEKMWISLENAERKKYGKQHLKNSAWVHYFIMHVTCHSDLPDYFYQNKTQRKKLFENISTRSGHLKNILQRYRLDYRLAYSGRRKIFDFHKGFSPDNPRGVAENEIEAPKASELLDRLLQHIEDDLNKAPTAKIDKKEKARQFVYDMALYFKNTYDTPLNAVIATATHAIHNVNYTESQIRKILIRTDMGKDDDEFRPFAHPYTAV